LQSSIDEPDSLSIKKKIAPSKAITPAEIPGILAIDVGITEKMIMEGVMIIDVRKKIEFAEGRIPGALFIPYKEKSPKIPNLNKFQLKKGKDKFSEVKLEQYIGGRSQKVILYCERDYDWRAYKAAQWLKDSGFTGVHWYRGGFSAWKVAGKPIEK
jgi:rhodanese-related sulfurtransferase